MDYFPLWNSLRIALISSVFTFFIGIFFAYYIEKLPGSVKGVIDVVLTMPLVLPPTVIGFFLLKLLGPNSGFGTWFAQTFSIKLVMNWYSSIFATIVVTFPLMYRTARGAFESFDRNLKYAAQTLGKSNSWIFWRITFPNCRQGILAGAVLSFARALGEYGATSMVSGFTPGKTATISTTVYHMWRTGKDDLAFRWVMINVVISFVVLVTVNMLEKRNNRRKERAKHA